MSSYYSQTDAQITNKLLKTMNSIRNYKGSTVTNRYQSLVERLVDLRAEARSRPALSKLIA